MTVDSSVSASLEHLVSASQGVLSKRIDLVLLEVEEMLSRSLASAALGGVCILLLAGGWFAVAGSLVLLLFPDSSSVLRLFAFGLVNGAGALGSMVLLMRHSRPGRANGPMHLHEKPSIAGNR